MRFGPKGAIVFWPKGAILLGQKGQNYMAFPIRQSERRNPTTLTDFFFDTVQLCRLFHDIEQPFCGLLTQQR